MAFPPVQSVVRAVDLLKALNRQPVSTLDQLHQQMHLPKPSIVRLLQTLASLGLVRQGPQHGTYFLTSEVRTLAAGFHSEPKAIECAAPVLEALTARHKWPLTLAVLEDQAAVVRYSTIPHSPLSLLHSTVGLRHSLVSRALGRAILAFHAPDERDAIIDLLRQSDLPEDQPAKDAAKFIALLDATRAQGYAVRDPQVRPVSNTIAVPVFEGARVVASIGLTYFSSTHGLPEALERYLNDLQQAAQAISACLSDDEMPAAAPARRAGSAARAPQPSDRPVQADDAGVATVDDASPRKGAEPPASLDQVDTSLVESFIGYSTRRASLAIVDTFMERMAPHDLRPVSFTLLGLIAANPGIMSSQLCALLKIQSSNLVALVKELHGRDLIERQAHPNDVRAWGLHLTARGRRFMKKAQATALDAGLEATARLTEEERATLATLLRKIYQ